jgi:sugar phosphate isomerase/epimerase
MNHRHRTTRRSFLRSAGSTLAALGAGSVLVGESRTACLAAENRLPPVAVFSKVYQELKLDFPQSAEVTAEAGMDGIDCAVRPGGEILPEQAADSLPRYAEALGKRRVRMLLLTTAIQGVDSPHAAEILKAGKELGIRYYRLGFWSHRPEVPAEKLRTQIRASLKELAAMNRQLGLCALFQNHSAGRNNSYSMAGGDLGDMYEIVKDFNADEIGVAFDLGHALITHGDQWSTHFRRLQERIRVVYVKDVRQRSQFVPFGQGEFGRTGFFPMLAKLGYHAPLSMHVEYEWAPHGHKTQAALVEALKGNRQAIQRWWNGA